ncbi:hypothetical protein M569_02400 [Genlisea aurea]|uniref:Nucleotide-diphospho-sugar transferase domain-containing protein n=1 Tax=Genlisea aurea TaxID=192259 RepID=S8CY89_9LAMI|nr:hypothetical protein M569_02400 [Genlisea aurea]
MPILQDGTKLELEKVLASACMDNKTVFLTTLNKAWIEKDSIFDLYLSSFKYGIDTEWMLKHLIVICIDEEAYEHCRNTTTLYCYYFEIEGVGIANAANFMTPNYIEIVIRRNEILQDALHLGYNVFFTVNRYAKP